MTASAARPLFGSALARSGAGLLSHMVSANPATMLARNPFLEYFKSLRDGLVATAPDVALAEYAPPGSPLSDCYFDARGIRLLDHVLGADLDVPLVGPWGELESRLTARAAHESADLAAHVSRLRADDHRTLMDNILCVIAEVRGCTEASWVGLQEPWIADFFPALARTYPDARFVMLLRDPRAIVASLKRIARTEPDQVVQVMSYARHWRKYAALATQFASQEGAVGGLLADRLMVVRYEDLAADPRRQMAALCEFLDVPFTDRMIDPSRFHDYNTGRPFRGNSSFGEVGEQIDAAAGARWRREAEPGLIAAVEWLCGPEMARLGYGLESPDTVEELVALRYLAADAGRPSAWRSDFGDLQRDLGYELFRRAAIQLPDLDAPTLRRAFLFTDVHEALAAPLADTRGTPTT